jgi:hypothetical protein
LFGCGLMLTGILISQLAGQYGVKKYEIRDTKYEDSPGG